MKNAIPAVILLGTLICFGAETLSGAETLWESSFRNPEDLKSWSGAKSAAVKPDGLYILCAEPLPGLNGIWKTFDAGRIRGALLRFSGERKGIDIGAAEKDHLGPKAMFVSDRKAGAGTVYSDVPGKYGSFDWTSFEHVFQVPDDAEKVRLFLGFQNGAGTQGFRSLKLEFLGTPLNLAAHANMAWRDDVAGDGAGGWSDQGPGMDGRCFLWPHLAGSSGKFLAGVPFQVATRGNAILTMRSAHFPNGPAEAAVSLAAPTPANELYLLHTLCWGPKEETEVGVATVRYEDGTSEDFPVRARVDVADWWGGRALANGAVGVRARSGDGDWRVLYASRFTLKSAGKKVASVRFAAANPATLWIVCAATLSESRWELPTPEEKAETTIAPGPEWLPVAREDFNRRAKGSALDVSTLVARDPVGTHGRVIARADGHLAFEKRPDRVQRFFSAGVDFKYEGRWQIDQLADELVKNGYNMVRVHIPENTLMHGSRRLLQFNSHYQDLFDYLIAALKKRGIYLMCDMAGSITYGWEPFPLNPWGTAEPDPSRRRKRLAVHFDPAARAEWRRGVEQLLCRVNPYTQTRLVDDPVLAMVMGYNEQEFEFSRSFDRDFVAPHYRAFLRRKYGAIGEYNDKRGTAFAAFDEIPCFAARETADADGRAFLHETETNTAEWYRQQLRELGYPGLVASYNVFKTHHFNRIREAACDYVAMNSYHAHPTNWVHRGSEISQESAIAKSAGLFRDVISGRLGGKPFVVTEYGCVYWNRYRYEQPFVFGAYAAFQGLDAVSMHSNPVSLKTQALKNARIVSFAGYTDPISVASEFLTFFLYLRGDVAPAPGTIRLLLPKENTGLDNPNVSLSKTQNSLSLLHGFSPAYAPDPGAAATFTLRGGAKTAGSEAFSQSIDESANLVPYLAVLRGKGILPKENRSNGINVFESSTGELLMDTDRNAMRIDTPRFQGVCAEAGGGWRLGDFEVESMSVRGNLSLVSIDGRRNIREAERLVLVYATNALTDGAIFAEKEMTKLLHPGNGAALLQRGAFRVRIRNRHAASLNLYPLDLAGNRLNKIPSRAHGTDAAVFEVDTGRDGVAVFFEIATE